MLWQWANNRINVFILDLDGTLMPSAEIDNQCFWQAVFACFGERESLPDLHGFTHVTDSGILDEWCLNELGRSPHEEEVEQIRQRFLQLLETASIRQSCHFKPLPGVINWLEAVSENSRVHAGIATGGWEHSARLKLKLSGLDRFDLPLASSDDAIARTDIMEIAANKTIADQGSTDTVFTYIGDGAWDLHASRLLGWEFIGIASGQQATRLKKAGANRIHADFRKALL